MEKRIGIIGGSGLGNALLAQLNGGGGGAETRAINTPFGPPSADPILMDLHGVPVAFLARHGIGHTLAPSHVPYRANIFALKSLGCQWILASGAVGSLQEHIAPRDLVVPDQVIDRTFRRVPTFFDPPSALEGTQGGGAVHVEFAEPFCPQLRQIILASAPFMRGGCKIHPKGTYICMEGPAFSTRAESLLHKSWGADLIGMTAMPEAKLAREAEISYALIALATDYDCWKPHPPHLAGGTKLSLLTEIIGHLNAATENALKLIEAALPHVWAAREQDFATHHALELAIWSDKARIDPVQRQRLDLLWGKYFPPAAQ